MFKTIKSLILNSKNRSFTERFYYFIYLPKIIYFNFYYLPFKQAIKLPILLYNVRLKNIKGKLIIDSKEITTGMIQLGNKMISLYEGRNNPFIWEHRGVCCFKGKCIIGNNSALSTGKNGYIEFGNNIVMGAEVKIACYKSIIIGNETRIAWEVIIIDTDFHSTVEIESGQSSITTKDVKIGNNNWIGIRSLILKGTKTPDFCIIGANSLVNKEYDVPIYSLIAGQPAKLVKQGIYRDLNSFVT